MERTHWVFAYGSIMFRRDFEVLEERPGLLSGMRRVFGQPSIRNWGTPACPAPTASLVPTGEVWGLALRIDPSVPGTLDDLIAREASTPEVATVETAAGPVRAFVWTMGSAWADWDVPRLVEAAVANVACGGGPHGDAWDYVDGMVATMRRHRLDDGFVDAYHRALGAALGREVDRR